MKRITSFLIPIVLIAVIVYDIIAFDIGGADATISGVIRSWNNQMPTLVAPLVAAGMLGLWLHFFAKAK